jgi:hypothetical protein
MRLGRLGSSCVVLVVALAAGACEPADAFSPPATPQNAAAAEPANEMPPAPEPIASAADEGAKTYASGEVAIGTEGGGYEDDDPSALADFRPALEPHGTWTDDSTYGTVWVPSTAEVGADFHPYVTAGHWVYEDDWVWVSDYDWGWAPFHYGRWVSIEGRGWAWIPGRLYRGAWVTWGVDDGYTYLGWAPMPPAFIWFGGVAAVYPGYVAPRWVYCPRGEVFSPVVRTRVVAGAAAAPIAARVRPYVPAAPGVVAAGPPPQKLGFQAAQIPRPTGAAATGVVRAQQFARPSTAQGLGARAPTPMPVGGQIPRGPIAGTAPHAMERAPRVVAPGGAVPSPQAPTQLPSGGAWRNPSAGVRSDPPVRVAPTAPPMRMAPTPPPVRVAPPSPPPPIRVSPTPRVLPSPTFRGGGAIRR